MIKKFNIANIEISAVNLLSAISFIEKNLNLEKYGYICVTNSRTTYIAKQNAEYCKIQNESLLTVPDGIPLVWIAHNKGYNEVGKVSGKDLMDSIFKISKEKGYSHYFFGSTPITVSRIKNTLENEYPNIEIKGAISPPFQSLDQFDINAISREINILKPTFFWCGLGAPKQEHFIALLQPKLEATICVGVGLAFEYLAKTVKRAPLWMQVFGFEWLYRLAQQPKNLKRAIRPLLWIFTKLLSSITE